MVRQAHHERLNLMAVTQSVGTIIAGGLKSYLLHAGFEKLVIKTFFDNDGQNGILTPKNLTLRVRNRNNIFG